MKTRLNVKIIALGLTLLALAAAGLTAVSSVKKLGKADGLLEEGRYVEAAEAYYRLKSNVFVGKKAKAGYSAANLRQADELLEKGEYDEAIKVYSRANEPGLKRQANHLAAEAAMEAGDYAVAAKYYSAANEQELAKQAFVKGAEAAMEAGDYKKAAGYYTNAGDSDKNHEAWTAYGDELLSRGLFSDAIDAYRSGRNDEKVRLAYECWGDSLLEQGDADAAAKYYSAVNAYDKLAKIDQVKKQSALESANRLIRDGLSDEVPSAIGSYEGQDVAELIFEALLAKVGDLRDEAATDAAGSYGRAIKNADTLLRYCRLLSVNGFDLKKVCPDGFEVEYDLARYNDTLKDSTRWLEPDYSKMLVFSRVLSVPSLSAEGVTDLRYAKTYADKRNKTLAASASSVKLHPELIAELPADLQAWTMGSATAIILLDAGYDLTDWISMETTTSTYETYADMAINNNGTTTDVSQCLYYAYSAYEAIVVFDVAQPGLRRAYHSVEINEPALATALNKDGGKGLEDIDIRYADANGDEQVTRISGAPERWNIEEIMVGKHDDNRLAEMLEDGAISLIGEHALSIIKL